MGSTHAVSGAAAWVAVTATVPVLPGLGWFPLDPVAVCTGTLVCAGAALLPDADHPNATIAHAVPVLGKAATGAVGSLTGGHRQGLHSVLAAVGVWFAALWLGTLMWAPAAEGPSLAIGVAVATAALLAVTVRVLGLVAGWPLAWLCGALGSAALVWFLPEQAGWFPVCVTLGFVVHLLGDFLTVGGVNWLWPLTLRPPKALRSAPALSAIWRPGGHFALPLLGRTGSLREHALGAALTGYTLAGLGLTAWAAWVSA